MKNLASYGVKFISCTEPIEDSPTGEFISTILAAAARYDNAAKAERITDCMLARVKAGLPSGKAKIGYLNFTQPDGKRIIIKDPERFDTIKKAWEMMETGAYTLKTISKWLNTKKITSKKGNRSFKLIPQQAHRIFTDKTYVGYAISKKHGLEIRSDKIPQMISQDTFFRVQFILGARHKTSGIYQRLRPEFPIKGFLKYAICGQPLRAGFSKGKKKYYGYYACSTPSHQSLTDEKVETHFLICYRKLPLHRCSEKISLMKLRKNGTRSIWTL